MADVKKKFEIVPKLAKKCQGYIVKNILHQETKNLSELEESLYAGKKSSKVKGMVFLKGKEGVCFAIPTASVTEVQEKWYDSQRWQLSVAMEQPEREGPREGYRNFRGQREGNQGFRGQREGNRGVRGQQERRRSFRGQRSRGGNRSNRLQNKGQRGILIKHLDSNLK